MFAISTEKSKVDLYRPFISFARPKETNQRKRRLFQGIFWQNVKNRAQNPADDRLKKSTILNLGVLYTYSAKKDLLKAGR
ncbi:hypothetical protein [Salegentibacter salinarum]|uniref:hypothetical protein n=1 Tax=Salegentibacter salinarum TaxID=447422 RepID=UPI0012FE9268|nr:hypothetical protein [Salegentibacter salinarum]